jgi:hypothetical protein
LSPPNSHFVFEPGFALADRPNIIYLLIDNWGFTGDRRGYAWHQIDQSGEKFLMASRFLRDARSRW